MESFFKNEELSISTWSGCRRSPWSFEMDRGVKIVHLATGIIVTCESERSQHKNRDIALEKLKEKVLEAL